MPIHPATVHFPIALLLLSGGSYLYYFFKDDAFFQRAALLTHIIGLGTMALVILTGNQAAAALNPNPVWGDLLKRHELLGYLGLWWFSMLLIWSFLRQKRFVRNEHIGFLALLWLGLAVMLYSAHLGGTMVYDFGVGVME